MPLTVSCIGRLKEIFLLAGSNLCSLDVLVHESVRAFGADVLSCMLSSLGRRGAGVLRETGADTVLGHVRFTARYCAPQPCQPASRQERRRRERVAAKGKRRKKNGTFDRKSGASGAYPFRDTLGLEEGMTRGLADLHNRAAAQAGSFQEGAETLCRLAGVLMSESTFMRRAYAAGRRALQEQELEVMRLALCGALPAHLVQALVSVAPTLYIMLDGTGVPCVKKDTCGRRGKDGRPAGTRELKVGVIGTFRWLNGRRRPVRDPGCETHIVSEKNAREFGSLLRRVANSRGYGTGGFRIQICGDGADWIAKIVEKAFPGADIIFVNDFYHACEHLHAFLGHVVKKGKKLSQAYKKARGILMRTGGSGLITHLQRFYADLSADNKDAVRELAYFKKRVKYMKYAQFRKEGLFIGSGIIEAACRTDVARRCKQAGMHWRLHNAAAMCALVARLRSGVPAKKLSA